MEQLIYYQKNWLTPPLKKEMWYHLTPHAEADWSRYTAEAQYGFITTSAGAQHMLLFVHSCLLNNQKETHSLKHILTTQKRYKNLNS